MIDSKTIIHIAKLARLSLDASQVEAYAQQLSKAIGYFDQIAEVNTDGVEPLVTPTEIEDYQREDIVEKTTSVEEIMTNAPQRTGNLFTVPPVV